MRHSAVAMQALPAPDIIAPALHNAARHLQTPQAPASKGAVFRNGAHRRNWKFTPAPGPDNWRSAQQHRPGPAAAAPAARRCGKTADNSPRPRQHAAPQRRQPRPKGAAARRRRARAAPRCNPFLQRGLARRLRQSGTAHGCLAARMRSSSRAVRAKRVAQPHARHRIPLAERPRRSSRFHAPPAPQQRARQIVQKFAEALVHHKARAEAATAPKCAKAARGVVRPVGLFGSQNSMSSPGSMRSSSASVTAKPASSCRKKRSAVQPATARACLWSGKGGRRDERPLRLSASASRKIRSAAPLPH